MHKIKDKSYCVNGEKYTYNYLISLKYTKVKFINKIYFLDETKEIDRNLIKTILRDIRKAIPKVYNEYLKEDINITMEGLKHYNGSHNKNENISSNFNDYLSIIKEINMILNYAIPLNELTVREKHIKNTYVLGALVNIDKELHVVRFIVNKFNNLITEINFNNIYAINQKKVRIPTLTSAVPSIISIHHFLEITIQNKLIKDILSDDVLNKFQTKHDDHDKVSKKVKFRSILDFKD